MLFFFFIFATLVFNDRRSNAKKLPVITQHLSAVEKTKIMELRKTMLHDESCIFHTRVLAYAWGKNPRQITQLDRDAKVNGTFERKARMDKGISKIEGALSASGVTVPVPEIGNAPVLSESIRAEHPQFMHPYRGAEKRFLRKECKMEGCKSQSMVYCGKCEKTYCMDRVGEKVKDITKCCFYAHICEDAMLDFDADDPFHAEYEEWNKRRLQKDYRSEPMNSSSEARNVDKSFVT